MRSFGCRQHLRFCGCSTAGSMHFADASPAPCPLPSSALYENPFESEAAEAVYNGTESWRDEVCGIGDSWQLCTAGGNIRAISNWLAPAGAFCGDFCTRSHAVNSAAAYPAAARSTPFASPTQLVPLTQLMLEPPSDVVYTQDPAQPCPQGWFYFWLYTCAPAHTAPLIIMRQLVPALTARRAAEHGACLPAMPPPAMYALTWPGRQLLACPPSTVSI